MNDRADRTIGNMQGRRAMTTPRLNAAFERRIQIAERWFGLRDPEDIAHFLCKIPISG